MWWTWLAGNTGRKNDAQLCRAESLQQSMCRQLEKNLLNSSISSTSSQYGELRPTRGWDRFGSLEHPIKFQRVSRLGFVTAATSFTGGQPNFTRLLGCYNIYTFSGALPPDGILPRAKFTLRPKSCVLLHWQCYCTALQQRGQPNIVAWYKEWNYGTFAEGTTYIRLGGHHVGHRPAFYTVSQKSFHLLTVCNFVKP